MRVGEGRREKGEEGDVAASAPREGQACEDTPCCCCWTPYSDFESRGDAKESRRFRAASRSRGGERVYDRVMRLTRTNRLGRIPSHAGSRLGEGRRIAGAHLHRLTLSSAFAEY
ncbi:hypothetical protein BCR35DRAFT_170150 [Leucosporidium creatinivorum]|uniref:Uncharacterized protein n=1 Tax=Leucosporidium creatinivorum TaxID=106004 RepID=A0A1Y2ECK9_9BASI|nr:hypothetical protein BCR35DRAFT_170150 [Leucosporidium creatinivorum]